MASLIRFLQEHVFDLRLLDALERLCCGAQRPSMPPMFIVGPPRSGTTLVYQLMVISFRVSYLSNVASLFTSLPCLTTGLTAPIFTPPKSLRPSRLGFIQGFWEPNEAGRIMRKWFDGKGSGDPARKIARIERILGGPFVNKNTFNSGRIEEILRRVPKSVFIHVRRDLVANAASLYAITRNEPGHRFGYYPRGFPQHRVGSLAEYEVRRVLEIHREIEEGLSICGLDAVEISYEELCASPRERLLHLWRELATRGLELRVQESALDEFGGVKARSSLDQLTSAEVAAIRDAVAAVNRGQ